jgi:serine/threonine protein kinase
LEFCGGGDLKQLLKEHGRFNEFQVQYFMRQIASALKCIHQQNIVHRDLKPQNILLTEKSTNSQLKLADFGLAKAYEKEDELFETNCGTPIYMAPEIQMALPYTDKADLWSVGVIMFELLAGVPPFTGQNK